MVMALFALAWLPPCASGNRRFQVYLARAVRSVLLWLIHMQCAFSPCCSSLNGARRIAVQGWPFLQSQRLMLTVIASPSCLLQAFLVNVGLPISMRIPRKRGRQALRASAPC